MKSTAKPGKQEVGKRLPKQVRLVPKPTWHQRLEDLNRFKKEHGHYNVPYGYSPNKSLANWVSNVRSQKHSGKIASELARRLDELGFTWVLRRRKVRRWDWDAMVAALTAFKKRRGHCCVPKQPEEYRALAMWLIGVRHRKRKGLLDRGRIRQLDRLGVVWEPNNQEWEDMFAEFLAYRAKHGDCNMPIDRSENPRLASWVHFQRRSRELVEYKRIHGHCRVPQSHSSLGRWVNTVRGYRRRAKLSEERVRRLDLLGFTWDMPPGSRQRD